MNNIVLIGRLTKDIELNSVGDNTVGKFGLAVNRRFKREGGQEADFFNVSVWNKLAELCDKYISKGSKVAISGRIEIQQYKDDNGNNKSFTNIVADNVEFLDNKSDSESKEPKKESKTSNTKVDDLPF